MTLSVLARGTVSGMSLVDISRLCSVYANNSHTPPESFWDEIVDRLRSGVGKSSSIVSTVHILDRIAANGAVPDQLDALIDSIAWRTVKLSHMDGFLAARALLLLGYSEEASFLVGKCGSWSIGSLVQIATLSGTAMSEPVLESLTQKLNADPHAFSSIDLVSAVKAIAMGRRINSNRRTSEISLMKKLGTELVRRIELRTISPHSCAELVQVFSGLPPLPIHPLLLQACYASLLENRNYTSLSQSELASVLHASALSEIENLVLTQCILTQLVQLLPVRDPRVASRILQGFGKSFVPAGILHALTTPSEESWTLSSEEGPNLVTGLLNRLTDGVCQASVQRLVQEISMEETADDLATLALLACASDGMDCRKRGSLCEVRAPHIPGEALEITEKANPALPRSDLKKKRLAKRATLRGASMFDSLRWGEESQSELTFCQAGRTDIGQAMKIFQTLLSQHTHLSAEACRDVVEAIHFIELSRLDLNQLRMIRSLLNVCVPRLDVLVPPKLEMEERRSDEASVAKLVRSLISLPATVGAFTNSRTRISILLV